MSVDPGETCGSRQPLTAGPETVPPLAYCLEGLVKLGRVDHGILFKGRGMCVAVSLGTDLTAMSLPRFSRS